MHLAELPGPKCLEGVFAIEEAARGAHLHFEQHGSTSRTPYRELRLTKTCGVPPHQGRHRKLLPLLQLRSGGKVLNTLFLYSHTDPSRVWADDRTTSPIMTEDESRFKPSKRARTRSPDSVRRGTATKVKERIRARTEEYMRRMNTERDARRDARNQALMEDIIAELPEEYIQPSGT